MLVEISARERDEMIRLVDNALSNTREEIRHTGNPEWRDWLREEESVLQSIEDRLKLLNIEVPLTH